jgi:hypothetical protein
MRGDEDMSVMPIKKLLKKKPGLRTNVFSLPVSKKIRHISHIKNPPCPGEEFPMDKWKMPPQPQRFLKFSDYDLL